MQIKRAKVENLPTTVGQLNTGDQFEYENKVYIKIAPVAGGELRTSQSNGEFNAVMLEKGTAFIFRDHHRVVKVMSSEYTYSL